MKQEKAGASPLCTGLVSYSNKVHDKCRHLSCLTDVQIRLGRRFNFGPPPWLNQSTEAESDCLFSLSRIGIN